MPIAAIYDGHQSRVLWPPDVMIERATLPLAPLTLYEIALILRTLQPHDMLTITFIPTKK